MRAISLLAFLLKRFPLLMTVNLVLMVLSGLLESLTVVSLVPVLDYMVNPELTTASSFTQKLVALLQFAGIAVRLETLVGTTLACALLAGVFAVASGRVMVRTKYVVIRELTCESFRDFFAARWRFFSSGSQGMFLNTFITAINQVGDAFGHMIQFFALLVRLGFYIAVPMFISWPVTLIGIAIAAILATPFMLLNRYTYRLGQVNTTTANETTAVLQESFGLAKLIVGFGNPHKSLAKLMAAFDAHVRATVAFQTLQNIVPAAYRPLGLIVLGITLFVARQFGVGLSETAVILLALFQSIPVASAALTMRISIDNFFPPYEQVRDLQRQARALRQRSGERQFRSIESDLSLERVFFTHPGADCTLLDFNLTIEKGQMVALVGESGAGKSTLLDIIMGLHEPDSGQVLLDGTPLEEFDILSYRQRVGYVPQDAALFNMSVRDNLLWSNEGATATEIHEACRLANAVEFIDQLPEGYDTIVGDRGVRLSGGQVQRLALARAILRKPALLILDEATSSLDTHSERLIQQAIEEIAKELTVVVVAHRLSTIRNADHIVVLAKGRIVEEGTYEDLRNAGGYFSSAVRLQSLQLVG